VTNLREDVGKRLEADPHFRAIVFRFDASAVTKELGPAQELSAYIFDELRNRAITIAWVPEATRPLGAAIGPIFACQEIALGRDAVLAALADDPADDPVAFDDSFRRQIERHATHYLRPSILASALVSRDHDAILKIILRPESERRTRWEQNGRTVDFLTRRDLEQLDHQVRNLDVIGSPEEICPRGRALKVPAEKLREWEVGDYPPASGSSELLIGLLEVNGVSVDPSRVVDLSGGSVAGGGGGSTFGQAVVDFLNRPVLRILLILAGCLGVLIELKMPGTAIPGICGLLAFIVLFVSSLFPVSGAAEPTATIFEVILFFLGLGLIAVEFFLMPGVGLFAVAGGALALFSLIVAMVPPHVTPGVPQHLTPQEAIGVLIVGFGIGALGFAWLLRYLPKSRWGRGGIVNDATIGGVPDADSAIEAQLLSQELIGKRGKTVTPLRPAGKVLLESGREIDVVAEGGYVDRGETVEVARATSMRIEVRHIRGESSAASTGAT